ncbi:MAG: D-glycero-beta-D-manno-heptose 1,7-bisphosphate 7-phosphatase [Firmicutes bacterium]|nr:D-glycero-beta-D-manno-heptose 1,7-bisphosphate 7-phosphatase [Bacillota bacterium]
MMGNRAVFLDRDGTINVEANYLRNPDDLQLLPGVADGIKLLKDGGFMVIVITNQSAVARGFCSEKTLEDINWKLQSKLMELDACIDRIYYCPHHPTVGPPEYQKNCSCRKPKPGMLIRASTECDIDLSASYLVGDKLIDIEAGRNAGCRSILVLTGYGKEEMARLDASKEVRPDYIAQSLLQAAKWILRQEEEARNPHSFKTPSDTGVFKLIRLNLGCGGDYREDYVNIDIRTTVKTDICCSVDKLPFPDNYADYILAKDILEHFGRLEVESVLREWVRVLKEQCEIEVITPNLEAICSGYLRGDFDTDRLVQLLYGHQDYPENTHRAGFDLRSMAALMERCGLEVLDVHSDGGSNLIAKGRKPSK